MLVCRTHLCVSYFTESNFQETHTESCIQACNNTKEDLVKLKADSLPSEPPGKPKNTVVGCYSLLQGMFPIHGSNPGVLHYRHILYHLGHQEGPHASSAILKHNHKNATWCSSEDETLSGHFFFLPCSLLYYLFFLYRVFT